MSNHPSGMHGPVTKIRTSYRLAENPEDNPPEDQTVTVGEAGPNARESLHAQPTREGPSTDASVAIPSKQTRCQRRAKRRILLGQENGGIRKAVVRAAVQKRVGMSARGSLTSTDFARSGLKAAEGGWLGSRTATPPAGEFTVDEPNLGGLRLVEWDGM